jgi:EpsI family protein
MIDRRQVLFGGACLLSAAAAEGLRPRRRLSLLGGGILEEITPTKFGTWEEVKIGSVLQPREEGTLSAKLYSQIVGRVYQDRITGTFVMLALAYGDTQSDLLQLHRPETCYPAFGFTISDLEMTQVEFAGGAVLPTRSMVASAPDRVETVMYWTRLGESIPTSTAEQRIDKFKAAIAGYIPDGLLVRCSTPGDGRRNELTINSSFLRNLILALAPVRRPAFIGTRLAHALPDRSGL